ncbi:hypothetical protein KCV07_g858, partial [Aureobasidium melanogenum]
MEDNFHYYTKAGLEHLAEKRGVPLQPRMTVRQLTKRLRDHQKTQGQRSNEPSADASSNESPATHGLSNGLGQGRHQRGGKNQSEKSTHTHVHAGSDKHQMENVLAGRESSKDTLATLRAIAQAVKIPIVLPFTIFLSALVLDSAGYFPFAFDVASQAPALLTLVVLFCFTKITIDPQEANSVGELKGHEDSGDARNSSDINITTHVSTDDSLHDTDRKMLSYADEDKRALLEEIATLRGKTEHLLEELERYKSDKEAYIESNEITKKDLELVRVRNQELENTDQARTDSNNDLQAENTALITAQSRLERRIEELESCVKISNESYTSLEQSNSMLKADLSRLVAQHFRQISFYVIGRVRAACEDVTQELAGITVTQDNTITLPSWRLKLDNSQDKSTHPSVWDYAFGPQATNQDVFMKIEPWIEINLTGQDICIMAVGQSGTGKSYTLFNQTDSVVVLSAKKLFDRLTLRHSHGFEVRCSAVEIYLNTFRDLLSKGSIPIVRNKQLSTSKQFEQLAALSAPSARNVADFVRRACDGRKVASTLKNSKSSRGHMIFLITVSAVPGMLDSQMCFIDLAGNESGPTAEDSEIRVKETKSIHESLSSVYNYLLNPDTFPPGRGNLLEDFLRNDLRSPKMVLMPHISPFTQDLEKSLTTARSIDQYVFHQGETLARHANRSQLEVRRLFYRLLHLFPEDAPFAPHMEIAATSGGTALHATSSSTEEAQQFGTFAVHDIEGASTQPYVTDRTTLDASSSQLGDQLHSTATESMNSGLSALPRHLKWADAYSSWGPTSPRYSPVPATMPPAAGEEVQQPPPTSATYDFGRASTQPCDIDRTTSNASSSPIEDPPQSSVTEPVDFGPSMSFQQALDRHLAKWNESEEAPSSSQRQGGSKKRRLS